MKILITGAAGFLGSHLSIKFIELGHTVVGLDDFSTGNLENLKSIINKDTFELIEHDVRIPINLKVDLILNFACPASPKYYQLDPVRTMETNVLGAINLLNLARDKGSRILQASTSEIYGDPKVSPQVESYWGNVNPIGIRSCYDEGKRAVETLFFDFKRQYTLDTRVIRIFNTYGPNMSLNDGRVVSNIIVQAIQNNPISIYGDGEQTRSFCYVSDLIDAIYKISTYSGTLESPINLGNPQEFSITELVKKIIKISNSSSRVMHVELPLDDPRQRKPDISQAFRLFGWKPLVNLDSGLMLTIDYFRNKLLNA
jgi:UDP-glucuronate decarboxylase